MALLSRTDRSMIANWWWTIDRWSLAAIATLDRGRRAVDVGCEPRRCGADRLWSRSILSIGS